MFNNKKINEGFPYVGLGMSYKYYIILTVANMPDTNYIH